MKRRVGSLRDISFVGQDPRRIDRLEAQLFEDFKPRDVIEEIWLSEIASVTATIEYYRHLEVSINYNLVAERGLNELLALEEYSDRRLSGEILNSDAFIETMGKISQDDLKGISTIIDIINKLRRERERIYNNFDRKRRPSLIHSVKYLEEAPEDNPTIQNLTD